MLEAAAVFVVALLGGLLPLVIRWNDRTLHSALAFSTGVFLGAVFLHLLPSLAALQLDEVGAAGTQGAHVSGPQMVVWMSVLVGVLGVYLVETLLLRRRDLDDRHHHEAVGYAALIGLSIHSLTTGVGFAVAENQPGLYGPLVVAILSHKGVEGFSVTSVFLLAESPRKRIVVLVLLFSLVTPLGMLAGRLLTDGIGQLGLGVVTALAAGTFLFVALCELLPEVFHRRTDGPRNVLLLLAGIALVGVFHVAGA